MAREILVGLSRRVEYILRATFPLENVKILLSCTIESVKQATQMKRGVDRLLAEKFVQSAAHFPHHPVDKPERTMAAV